MNCKRCGYLLTNDDQFCKNCGAPVNEMNAQNVTNFSGNVVSGQPVNDNFGSVQQPMNNQMQQPVFEQPQPVMNNQMQQPVFEQPQSVINNQMQQPVFEQPQPVINNQMQQPVFEQPQPVMNNQMQQPVFEQPQPVMNNQMQQPTFSNGYSQNVEVSPKKNNSVKFMILGIVLVVVVGASIFFGIKFLGGKSDEKPSEGTDVAVNTPVTHKVNFKNFSFDVPNNLEYQISDSQISLMDEDGIWTAAIEVLEGSYTQLLSNRSKMKSIYQNAGFVVANDAVEKKINGESFITIELVKGGTNILLGFTDGNGTHCFGATIVNIDNEYDYEVLEEIAKIFSSAEYNAEANNMGIDVNVDMSILEDLAK